MRSVGYAGRLIRYEQLAELQRSQLGVLSRRQLRTLGWTRRQIDHEIAMGRWAVSAPEVICLQNAPLTYDQRLWLGVLHAGVDATISHSTACRVQGLTG